MVILQSNYCTTLLLLLQRQWAIPKMIQTVGIKDIKFLGVLKKEHVEISGLNQKRSGISKGFQEKLMWNFHGSSFFTLEFLSGATQFCKISRDESLFFVEFLKVK